MLKVTFSSSLAFEITQKMNKTKNMLLILADLVFNPVSGVCVFRVRTAGQAEILSKLFGFVLYRDRIHLAAVLWRQTGKRQRRRPRSGLAARIHARLQANLAFPWRRPVRRRAQYEGRAFRGLGVYRVSAVVFLLLDQHGRQVLSEVPLKVCREDRREHEFGFKAFKGQLPAVSSKRSESPGELERARRSSLQGGSAVGLPTGS